MNQHHSPAKIISGEAGIAGVQWALQSPSARRLLRQELCQMLPSGSAIGPLELTRAKYKPGRNLLAYYTFTAQFAAVTRTVPVAVEWRDPANNPQAAAQTAGERVAQMQAEAQRRGLLAPFLDLQRDVADWGIRLQIWPLDPDFPQLVRLADPAHAAHLFRSAGIPLEVAGEDCVQVIPLRYRPDERHVLKYLVAAPDGSAQQGSAPTRLYAKLYADGQAAERAQRIAGRVVDWLEDRVPGFGGIRPAGWSAEDAVILYPHAEGTALSQLLRRSPAWVARQVGLVGQALAELHHAPESLVEDLAPSSFEKEVKAIARAGQQVQALLPETGAQLTRLLQNAQEQYTRLPQAPPTFTHSDFKADHLLVSRAGITLIDFDTCALADPALDVGKFMADLEWWYTIHLNRDPHPTQQAFLAGYTGRDAPGWLERTRLYQALILAKITLRRAKVYSRDWAAQTERMIGRAEELVKKY